MENTGNRNLQLVRNNYLDWRSKTKNEIHILYIDMMLEKLDRGEKLSYDESVAKYYDKVDKKLYWGTKEAYEALGSETVLRKMIDHGRIVKFK